MDATTIEGLRAKLNEPQTVGLWTDVQAAFSAQIFRLRQGQCLVALDQKVANLERGRDAAVERCAELEGRVKKEKSLAIKAEVDAANYKEWHRKASLAAEKFDKRCAELEARIDSLPQILSDADIICGVCGRDEWTPPFFQAFPCEWCAPLCKALTDIILGKKED